jgi:hypothetical protein
MKCNFGGYQCGTSTIVDVRRLKVNGRLLYIVTRRSNKFVTKLTFNDKGKGKGHPCTGTEVLYRPYGP